MTQRVSFCDGSVKICGLFEQMPSPTSTDHKINKACLRPFTVCSSVREIFDIRVCSVPNSSDSFRHEESLYERWFCLAVAPPLLGGVVLGSNPHCLYHPGC